jgi:hypothetical protein
MTRNMTALPRTSRPQRDFASFREVYPYYLAQHRNPTSRRLHVGGTLLALVSGALALLRGRPAWVGHFFFERNLPATFRHPLYSLRGDFTMLFETLAGRLRW